jgi:predicted nucleic acid-binding protein
LNGLVLDGSAILSFVLADERSAASVLVQQKLRSWTKVYVPGHWWLEITNALLMAERRGRIEASEIPLVLSFIKAFSVITDDETAARSWDSTLTLARDYSLTIYDAAYLELALRRRSVLATVDKALARAARAAGVALLS